MNTLQNYIEEINSLKTQRIELVNENQILQNKLNRKDKHITQILEDMGIVVDKLKRRGVQIADLRFKIKKLKEVIEEINIKNGY